VQPHPAQDRFRDPEDAERTDFFGDIAMLEAGPSMVSQMPDLLILVGRPTRMGPVERIYWLGEVSSRTP